MSAILIPVQGSEEVVEVAISELAEMDPNDVIDILQAEVASLDLWLLVDAVDEWHGTQHAAAA